MYTQNIELTGSQTREEQREAGKFSKTVETVSVIQMVLKRFEPEVNLQVIHFKGVTLGRIRYRTSYFFT